MLSVKSLGVAYDQRLVLSNVYFEVPPGKVYGVLGPNGAGKSTLFKAMLGLVPKLSGETFFEGQPLSKQWRRLAYVPQRNDLDWNFPATVYDVVMMGRYPHKPLLSRIGKADRLLVRSALEELGLASLWDRPIGALSGGQQQRVFLARALCQQADLFFLDEPFVGVDAATEEKIVQTLRRLGEQGKTLLVVHHDLSTVKEYFDGVLLLNQRLVAAGPIETAFTEPNIAAAYGGQLTILHKAP
jgi:manganese/zinc/iron transport system ATP- binding protein